MAKKIREDNADYVKDYPRRRYEQDMRMIDLVVERGVNVHDFEDVEGKAEILGEFYNGLRVASNSDGAPFLPLDECSNERICLALRKDYLTASARINRLYAGKLRLVETAPKRARENRLVQMLLEDLENWRERKRAEERAKAESGEQLEIEFTD